MITVTTVDRKRGSDSIAQVKASVWLMKSVILTIKLRPVSPFRHNCRPAGDNW
jgi:hypothetical protein